MRLLYFSKAVTTTTDKPWVQGGITSLFSSDSNRQICYAKGGECWDQMDQSYIDFICGYGPVILGHANETVNQAVISQLEKGILFPTHPPNLNDFKQNIFSIFPLVDDMLLFKTGSEAVAGAVRLARAYTSKKTIIRCGFHGWHDSMISPPISWHAYDDVRVISGPKVPGIPDWAQNGVIPWDGRCLDDLEQLCDQHHDDLAGILLDPVQITEPVGDQLREIRGFADRYRALLIFDEIKTGFRVHIGGVQTLTEVFPDLTILGKGIANGFPLAVVVGSSDIISLAKEAKIMGTFNRESISIAAACATLSILKDPDTGLHLRDMGQRLMDGINRCVKNRQLDHWIQAVPYRWPAMPYLMMDHPEGDGVKTAFFSRLAENGVLLLPNHMSFICLSHSSSLIDQAIGQIDQTLGEFFEKK